jgi:DNA repair protein RecO (recombination protein O)
VHWLTPNHGRLATVAKGALRPKSTFRGRLDLFYLADFTFARSRRSELHTLREVGLRGTHAFLRQELAYLQQAAYCSALIEQATESETPLLGIFDLMSGLLQYLPTRLPQPTTLFAFELKLLKELGFQPDLGKAGLKPGSRQLVQALTDRSWEVLGRLRLSQPQVDELGQFLHGFLVYHLGRIPKGRETALRPGFS